MTALNKLIAAAIAYPKTEVAIDKDNAKWRTEIDALLDVARPQFEAIGAHLAALTNQDEFIRAAYLVHDGLAAPESPYSIQFYNHYSYALAAKHALCEATASQPLCVTWQRDLLIDIVSDRAQFAEVSIRPADMAASFSANRPRNSWAEDKFGAKLRSSYATLPALTDENREAFFTALMELPKTCRRLSSVPLPWSAPTPPTFSLMPCRRS